ncbi:MAG: ribosome-associated translation inhibitor RaiA [Thermoanaerobaculales bacterium]|jgi:putative sigma-54 modulation protein|nr:ribosome-associated translation inhibitor RaiA [Thermoanaerobaculales bacterium]
MRVDYVARKVTLDDAFRQLTEKKLKKVAKYFNDILDLRVEVAQERHLYVIDVFVKGKDFDIQSTSQNKELTGAIQEAVDKLEIQARRAKAKLKEHKGRGGDAKMVQDWEVEVFDGQAAAAGTPRIVERSTIPIRPMSTEDAIIELERGHDQFLVFRNASTDRINVLYRRSDNNLGLVTPEL